jgi:hypothetical protein
LNGGFLFEGTLNSTERIGVRSHKRVEPRVALLELEAVLDEVATHVVRSEFETTSKHVACL